MPFFSVVVPCHNAARHLTPTVNSVLAQDCANWELILVDDGSTDETPFLIDQFTRRDARIRAMRIANGGPARARNLGVAQMARGEVVAFLDADDLWSPDRLSHLQRVFSRPDGPSAVFNRVGFFREEPGRLDTQSSVPTVSLKPLDFLAENPVCTMSNMAVRTWTFRRTGGFDPRLLHNEDVEWLIRLAASGAQIEGVDRLLTFYRVSTTGLSADLDAMREGWLAAVESARRIGLTPSRSVLMRAEAVHLRYLARRALRTGAPGASALRLALSALRISPLGFFDAPRRGLATLAGALIAPVIPRRFHPHLFS